MKNIGLTGNIAAGKSTVSRLFAEWGATVLDADQIVHDLQRPGTPVFRAITDRFGTEVVADDGSLDRGALRRLVFNDKQALADLNAIVHPAVAAERDRMLEEARAARVKIVIHDIPLLFEVMDPAKFDAVVLVDAPVAARRERLERTRGLGRAEAESMIAAQMPSVEKRKRARWVIDNDGSFERLEQQARLVWKALQRL